MLTSSNINFGQILVVAIAMILFGYSSQSNALEPQVPTYSDLQTFKGKAYFIDENNWIYSDSFAKQFDMPRRWVSNKLTGIEAAAFRFQSGKLLCGLAGKQDNCQRYINCITDIYIDEDKHPLPWGSSNTSNWLPGIESSSWLFDQATGEPGRSRQPFGIPNRGAITLQPWINIELKLSVQFAENGSTQDHKYYQPVQTLAYRRNLPGNLTMVTLNYRCMARNKRHVTSFILAPVKDTKQRISEPQQQYSYFEFGLPNDFEQRIDDRLAEKNKQDEAKYKSFINID